MEDQDFLDSVVQLDPPSAEIVDTPTTNEPVTEPVIETPVDDSTPVTDPPKTDAPADEPGFSIETFLAEKSGGRIKTADDLQKFLSERDELEQKAQSYKPHEYKSHLAEAIDNYVAAGGTNVDGFLSAQKLEPEKLGDVEALLTLKLLKEPELSEEDHKALIEYDYPAPRELSEEEKDLMTEEEIEAHNNQNKIAKAKQIHLKREAIQARNELSTLKQQLMSPEPKSDPERQKAKENWDRATEKALSEFKGIEIPDEKPFHMELSASQKADVLKVAQNPDSFWAMPIFKNQDGSVNMNHVLSVIQFAQNPQLMKVVQENYLASAVDKLKDEIRNRKVPAKTPETPISNSEEPAFMEIFNH